MLSLSVVACDAPPRLTPPHLVGAVVAQRERCRCWRVHRCGCARVSWQVRWGSRWGRWGGVGVDEAEIRGGGERIVLEIDDMSRSLNWYEWRRVTRSYSLSRLDVTHFHTASHGSKAWETSKNHLMQHRQKSAHRATATRPYTNQASIGAPTVSTAGQAQGGQSSDPPSAPQSRHAVVGDVQSISALARHPQGVDASCHPV